LAEAFYYPIDEAFANSIGKRSALAGCKSLDAIHIATALAIRDKRSDKDVRIKTYDKMMVRTAQDFGFAV
jgi:hypothetical protein